MTDFWRDKHVIITGASSGLGWALAEHLAARGARLGLLARRREALEALAAALAGRGAAAACPAVADVCDAEQTRDAVQRCEAALGPCDIAIANAGVHEYSPGHRFDAHAAGAIIQTNVIGVTNLFGAVLPGMIVRRCGRLTAVASIASMLGLPEIGAYSASKAAVVTLMESLSIDLHRYGIRTTTVCPGFIDTPMIANHERRLLKFLLPAPEAARRIARAVERDRRITWFPWQTWLLARFARCLPHVVFRSLITSIAERKQGKEPTG